MFASESADAAGSVSVLAGSSRCVEAGESLARTDSRPIALAALCSNPPIKSKIQIMIQRIFAH